MGIIFVQIYDSHLMDIDTLYVHHVKWPTEPGCNVEPIHSYSMKDILTNMLDISYDWLLLLKMEWWNRKSLSGFKICQVKTQNQ